MRGFRAWIGRDVVVSTDSMDVKGRLIDVRGEIVVLRDASSVDRSGSTPVDGLLLVPAARIVYVQVVEP